MRVCDFPKEVDISRASILAASIRSEEIASRDRRHQKHDVCASLPLQQGESESCIGQLSRLVGAASNAPLEGSTRKNEKNESSQTGETMFLICLISGRMLSQDPVQRAVRQRAMSLFAPLGNYSSPSEIPKVRNCAFHYA